MKQKQVLPLENYGETTQKENDTSEIILENSRNTLFRNDFYFVIVIILSMMMKLIFFLEKLFICIINLTDVCNMQQNL